MSFYPYLDILKTNDYVGNMQFIPTKTEEKIFELLLNVVSNKSPSTILRVAGGIVRDRLLGFDSSDIDIAISDMSGEKFCLLISEYLKENQLTCGKTTVIKANPDQSKHLETAMITLFDQPIDFVNLRKETYANSRIPSIEIGTPEEDAARRDLTINALFYNIHTKEIEDYVNGLKDLEDQIARTPIDAIQTFIDDPLRILRIVRFATKYKLEIDGDIIHAAQDYIVQQALENKVSAERKWKEMGGYALADGTWKCGFLAMENSAEALIMLHKMDLIELLFPNLLVNVFRAIHEMNDIPLSFQDKDLLLLNIALLFDDYSVFYQLKNVLKLPTDMATKINDSLTSHLDFLKYCYVFDGRGATVGFKVASDTSIRRFLNTIKDNYNLCLNILSIRYGHFKEVADSISRTDEIVEELGGWKIPCPISGKDLIEIGFKPGTAIGEALKIIEENLFENPNLTKEEALTICKTLLTV